MKHEKHHKKKKDNDSKKVVIELKDVWKTYQVGNVEIHALRGLNLKIHQGEFIAIKGPSGSGKSTCMNMVGCLDVPTKGDIFLEKQNISNLSESMLAQIRGKKIGFIFQKFYLINTLSALENVALPMVFQGVPEGVRLKKAAELLKIVDLGERMHNRPLEMSGGQQQRVAIARSLINDPEIILADEPTGNLDSKTGGSVMDFLKKMNKEQKKTIVMVTHDDILAKKAQRIEYLKDGLIEREANSKGGK